MYMVDVCYLIGAVDAVPRTVAHEVLGDAVHEACVTREAACATRRWSGSIACTIRRILRHVAILQA